MNNKLEVLREEYNNEFPDPMTKKYGNGFALYCSNCSGEERNKRTDWWLSRFATIMDEVVESIVPEEKETSVSWDTAEGTDNWIVQFWEKDKNGIVTLIHSLDKNSDEGGGFILPSAIATIKNNYKEIRG